MNVLREVTKGGKRKLLSSVVSGVQELGTIAPMILHEPNVDTKKVELIEKLNK